MKILKYDKFIIWHAHFVRNKLTITLWAWLHQLNFHGRKRLEWPIPGRLKSANIYGIISYVISGCCWMPSAINMIGFVEFCSTVTCIYRSGDCFSLLNILLHLIILDISKITIWYWIFSLLKAVWCRTWNCLHLFPLLFKGYIMSLFFRHESGVLSYKLKSVLVQNCARTPNSVVLFIGSFLNLNMNFYDHKARTNTNLYNVDCLSKNPHLFNLLQVCKAVRI